MPWTALVPAGQASGPGGGGAGGASVMAAGPPGPMVASRRAAFSAWVLAV